MPISLSGSLLITGSLTASGTLTAQTLVVQTVTSSIVYSSGSNIFGNSSTDTQKFTGSVTMNPNGLFVSSSGLVGIGNVVPAYNLDVSGTGRFTGQLYANAKLEVNDTNGIPIRFQDISAAITGQTAGYIGMSTSAFSGNNGDLVLYPRTSATSKILLMGGNVGIGTSSPLAGLEVVTDSGLYNAMRLVSNRAYNLSTDVALTFRYLYDSTNYTSGGLIVVAKDNTTISNQSGNMQFYTNNAGTVAERMRITSGGNVLIGTTSTFQNTETLCVLNSTNASIFSKQDGGSGNWVQKVWNNATSGNNQFIEFLTETALTARGSITYNRGSGLTVYNTTSDYRLKSEISDFNALEIIANLKPKEFRICDAENKSIGFIAHELQEYLPQAVSGEKDAIDKDGNPMYQGVDYSQLTGLLVKAIQEMNTKLDAQNQTIQSLQEQNDALQSRIETLESK